MADYSKIPTHIQGVLERFRDEGRAPGHTITAFLANDLMEFVGRADNETIAAIRQMAVWVNYELPMKAHGSYEAVEAWEGLNADDG